MQPVFVLVKCELGRAYRVAEELAGLDGVAEVHSISGAHDLIAKLTLGSEANVGRFISKEIQTLPGIRDTFSLISYHVFKGAR